MKKNKKAWRWLAVIVIALALTAGGFYVYKNQTIQAQTPEEAPLQTTTVRRGDLVVSASGAGTVIPAAEVTIGFDSGGLLTELPVQVGDKVQAGDVLARVDDASARRQLKQAELDLTQAQLQLSKLLEDPSAADIASAQASLASAQATLDDRLNPATDQDIAAARQTLLSAQQKLSDLLAGPSDDAMTSAEVDLKLAEINVQTAQTDYDKVSWRPEVGQLPQSAALQEATLAYEKAKAAYDASTQGATDAEISSARASVAQAQSQLNDLLQGSTTQEIAAAQAAVDQAQAQLDSLMEGAADVDLELSQISVEQAQNSLETAQAQLAATELTAPISGTVLAVDASVGERVGSAAFITLADLDQPRLEVYLDETDLDNVAPGYEADVVFDALPDQTFVGHVIQVDPQLTNSNGTTVVRAVLQLDSDSFSKPQVFPIGMNAAVDVIGGRATRPCWCPWKRCGDLHRPVCCVRSGKRRATAAHGPGRSDGPDLRRDHVRA
ncbi:MAG: efflux RND transporter periplasmic adaptor subunit [Caldilineales bacterium]